MSFKADIPTLSANEVYTLTFEYEGTETVQLIVGDLTLETTDRRVVFTTTSPVHYIESNVNLTNLNMYEGYYESDDFGGEYTQDSYIEGKSLINLMPPSEPKTLSQGWSLDFDETTGVATIVFNNNTNNFSCSMRSFGMMEKLKPATYYTYFVEILENSLVDSSGNKPNVTFYNISAYISPSTQSPYNVETVKGDCVGTRGDERYIIKNEASPGKYVWTVKTVDTFVDTMVDADKIFQTAALNGTIKVRMMIVEGDYVDNPIETNWFPQGIGCVKSPKILSQTKEPNLAETDIFQMSTSSSAGSSYDKETQTISITNTARATSVAFYFQPQKWGYGDYENFCVEFDVVYIEKLKDGEQPYFSLAEHATPTGDTKSTTFLYEGKHYTLYFGSSALLDKRSTLLRLTVNGGTGGINKTVTITNFKLYHVNNINGDYGASEVGTYDCCKITTPDNLELYDVYYGNGHSIQKQDILDLTTGTLTRNIVKWKLNDYLVSNLNYWGIRERSKKGETTNDYVRIQLGALGAPNGKPTLARGWSEVYGLYFDYWEADYGASYFYDGTTYFYATSSGVFFMCSKAQILSWTGVESYELLTKQHIYDWFIAGDFTMMNVTSTPTTEQISLNALKSYQNGSITTSSQQLAPTLTTTLPISNKFTTTNLTSGSTYNVYFDGTATKLDAGGTIITNPVSPCEVECGGTTLTIEGTDIQNVRVLETTNKNEVGSVNGTTDVELSRIRTKCSIHNYFDDYFQDGSQWSKDWNCSSVRDDNRVIITTDTFSYAGFTITPILSYGTYKFHCKVKVANVGDKYRVLFHGNPNGATNDTGGFAWAETTSTQLVEEINYVGYFRGAGIALFYGYSKGQVVEYYDISLIKLSDEDITGTDTSAINYSQITSDLEQPIKLRSLGTTYDSYNPVTGELTKRIGVSETDGSYSVLSSPIVNTINMGVDVANLITATFPITGLTNFSGDFKPNTTYTVFLDIEKVNGEIASGFVNDSGGGGWGSSQYYYTVGKQVFTRTTDSTTNGFVYRLRGNPTINSAMIIEGDWTNYDLEYFIGVKRIQIPPHLYTNGQVKVYSDSEVYPTTILNGQSTNNYEINELNTSNNYTIRYDGECESINLANKSNKQGTNKIVKSGKTSGNLTFVNDSGDIDNVLLVQNDVREQEINHFNGLQTVEVSQLLVSSKQNLFEQYMKNDFEFLNNVAWDTQVYGSLHNGVFKCGNLSAGSNLQWAWNLIKPHVDNVYGSRLKEDNPIVLANKVYNISFNISIVDHHTVNGNHNYNIRAFDFDGNEVSVQKATGGQAFLSTWSNGVTNPTTTNFINLDVIFSKDVYCFVLHADYGGQWKFDCTITDFTICEPEYAKPDIPLVYEYVDLPQPVQLNSLPDGTCDTYNTITGEYVQNVGYTDSTDYDTYYQLVNPIITQLTPITIPVLKGGILQLITTNGKVFPMVEYSIATNNRYDTSSWEAGVVYTQRNMTEAYFNESTTPMIPTETMTLTTDHISSGSIILNDNGNGLIVLKGNYTGRDIPYFTGMRSVEAIEVETTPSPDQPLFGKGGRK